MAAPSARTAERIRRMMAMHGEGASAREIGEAIGVGHRTVLTWLASQGLKSTVGPGPRARRERVRVAVPEVSVAPTEVDIGPLGDDVPVERVQRRLDSVSQLLDSMTDGLARGETSPQLYATLVTVEEKLAARVAELTPPPAPDPDKDPLNVEGAAEMRQRLAANILRQEQAVRCCHCGMNPYH